MTSDNKQSTFAIWLSLIGNIVLTSLKLSVGLLVNSQVLIADGVHNAGDIVATVAALSAMRVSKRPADEDHPYGHGKAEVVGAGLVAIILVIAALYIGYHAVLALMEPAHPTTVIALVASAISLVVKQWLYVYTMRVGKRVNSKGLMATAYDHLADVYASLAAVIGIALAMIGDHYDIHILMYGDPVAGIVVAYFVLKLAIHMGRESVDVLMEKNLDTDKLDQFAGLIATIPNVKRIDRIRARDLGHYTIIDVRVSVPGELTVQEGHDISRLIKQTIMQKHVDVEEVLVHINPWYEEESNLQTT